MVGSVVVADAKDCVGRCRCGKRGTEIVPPHNVIARIDFRVAVTVGTAAQRYGKAIRGTPQLVVGGIDHPASVVVTRKNATVATGRAARNRAGAPTGRVRRVTLRIDNLQRWSAAVGRSWPGTCVTVREILDCRARGAPQHDPLAAVTQVGGSVTGRALR